MIDYILYYLLGVVTPLIIYGMYRLYGWFKYRHHDPFWYLKEHIREED